MFRLVAAALALAAVSPASAHPSRAHDVGYRGAAPASLYVQNDLRIPLMVVVDGVTIAEVPPFWQSDLRLSPGRHDVRVLPANRACVLYANVVVMRPGAYLEADINRGCSRTYYYQDDRGYRSPSSKGKGHGHGHGHHKSRYDDDSSSDDHSSDRHDSRRDSRYRDYGSRDHHRSRHDDDSSSD